MTTKLVKSTRDEVRGKQFCLQAMYAKETDMQIENPLLIYKATADPDTTYLHQAMKEPDRANFLNVMIKKSAISSPMRSSNGLREQRFQRE